MDLLSMLMNAKIRNMDGDELGDVIGVHIAGGKMNITLDIDGVEDEDPEDGAKDDIPGDDASNKIQRLRAVGSE